MTEKRREYAAGLPIRFSWTVEEVQMVVGTWSQQSDEDGYQEYIQGRRDGASEPNERTAPSFEHLGLTPTGVEYCFDYGCLTQLRVFHEDRAADEIRTLLLQRFGSDQVRGPRVEGWNADGLRVSLFPHPEQGAMVVYNPLPDFLR
jgi:hypothetical protein